MAFANSISVSKLHNIIFIQNVHLPCAYIIYLICKKKLLTVLKVLLESFVQVPWVSPKASIFLRWHI